MKSPLPSDTRSILGSNNVVAKTSNLGLLFNKYVSVWSDNWTTEEKRGKDKINLKSEFLDKIEKQSICVREGKTFVESLYKRQSMMIRGLKDSGWHVKSFNAITDSRLIIGLGGTSVIETGMTLHPLYGFPYLPGSGLKGLARAYAEIAEVASEEELHVIFGSKDKKVTAADNIQGRVFFMDGLPTTFPKLDLDIMNPHYSEYYSGKKDTKGNPIPPADYLNPVPVTFLAVATGQRFTFAVYSKDKSFAEKAKQWLTGGLTELGAGGKTNVGYGYFKIESQPVQTQRTEVIKKQEDNTLEARFNEMKTTKSPERFLEFVKSIRPEELSFFDNVSFNGIESFVNIGIVHKLEGIEVSSEILRVIAQKMLEIITPNKKWDEKKHEKYRKLRSIAGKDF